MSKAARNLKKKIRQFKRGIKEKGHIAMFISPNERRIFRKLIDAYGKKSYSIFGGEKPL